MAHRLRKREMDREQDERESLRRRIEQDPNNLAAYAALGERGPGERRGVIRADIAARSYHPITTDDLERLRDIEAAKRAWFFDRGPKCHQLADRVLAVALCQGAAQHYVDGRTGIKDFDLWTFYAGRGVPDRYPAKVRMRADFGDPKFGTTEDSLWYIGRRVDLMGRSIDVTRDTDPVQAVCDYLVDGRTASAKCLARKAVVLLAPAHLLGSLIWLEKPVGST